jgi:predicted metal-dependent hydrolase
MKARRPALEFSRAPGPWIPDAPAYAYQLDSASLMLPYLEPYLIKVQKQARERLDGRVHSDLIRDVDLFNQQEANHFRLHAKYNDALRACYPGLEPFEREIRADFERFLRERSLGWNLAYCEGFECTGISSAEFFFGPAQPFLRSADPAARDLWAWHLAEEFEHRCVCHDTLRALYPGTVRRLRGYFAFVGHLQKFCRRVAAHLGAIDRERGLYRSPSAETGSDFRTISARFMRGKMLRVFSPRYDPAPLAAPGALTEALVRYEAETAGAAPA